jgi:hypothetical protein
VTREQLEHVIRAAAEITGDQEIVVVGSTNTICPSSRRAGWTA